MTKTISQHSAMPTRKLGAATIALAIVEVAWVIVQNFWPDYASPELKAALTPLVVFLVGYWVKDEPNVTPEFQGEL